MKINIRGEKLEITDSMKKAIDETERRREIQLKYNQKYGIIPQTIKKPIDFIHSKI